MRNFALFLLLGNIAWWGWQFFYQGAESIAVKEAHHANFIQAQTKLLMLSEVPAELPAENSNQKDVAVRKDSAPQSLTLKSDADVVPSQAAPPTLIPWCGVTSSFNSPDAAEKLISEWLRVAGEADKELVKEPGASTWWVYLPVSKDEEAIRLALQQLHEKQIDSYYMRTGELAGSISLGVFSRKVSASTVQQSVKKKGYAAEIKEIQRMDTKTQVFLKLHDRKSFDGPVVQGLLGKYGSTQVKEILCK